MNDEILKQMADELAEIRKLLTKVLVAQQDEQSLTNTKQEIAMVDALGIDPLTYLKSKHKLPRKPRSTAKKKRGQEASI